MDERPWNERAKVHGMGLYKGSYSRNKNGVSCEHGQESLEQGAKRFMARAQTRVHGIGIKVHGADKTHIAHK
jgi:hypothetical protein